MKAQLEKKTTERQKAILPDAETGYSYSDVEPYTYCYFRGRPGWILDKGGHIQEGLNAGHILIQYDDDDGGEMIIHENLVTQKLQDGRELWIDFDQHLIADSSY